LTTSQRQRPEKDGRDAPLLEQVRHFHVPLYPAPKDKIGAMREKGNRAAAMDCKIGDQDFVKFSQFPAFAAAQTAALDAGGAGLYAFTQ
jgi:hypothetical protein